MLRGEPISLSDLLGSLPQDVKQRVERISDVFSGFIEREMERYARGEGELDPASVADMIDKFIKSLESTGHASSVYSAPDLLKQSIEKAYDRVSQNMRGSRDERERLEKVRDMLDKVSEQIRKYFNSGQFAKKLIENLDPTKLSPEEWRKIIDEVMNTDMYENAGRGEGGGILDALVSKILVSPQFRFYLKEYLRDLRVAPSYRESYHPIGKFIDPRRTFRETSRTGIPLIVFRKPIVKSRTREDVIFIYDVSGSMGSFYALIVAVAQALSELGLNVKVWYAEEGGMRAVSRDFIRELESFGGGGTNLAEATSRVLSEERLRDTVVILYSDLYEGADEEKFVENMTNMKSRGAYPAVFAVVCSSGNADVRKALKERGIYVKCDVRRPKDFLEGLKELKHHIRRVSLIT